MTVYEHINEIYGYLHSFWRYRWSGLLIAWIAAVTGWVGVYALPNQYKVTATMNIDTTTILKPLLQGLAIDTNPQEQVALMSKLLLSRENMLAVIRDTDMDLGTRSKAQLERLALQLESSIVLSNITTRGSGSSVYEISYESPSAERAYKVVSTLLDKLIEGTLSSGRVDTVMAQEFIDQQIKEYEKRLSEDEARLAEFKKKNVGFMPDEKGGYFASLRKAQGDIDNTRSSLRLAQRRYSELRKQLSGETPMMGFTGANSSATKLRKYREQLSDLLSVYTEDHPNVQALRAKISDLQAGGTGGSLASDDEISESQYNPVYQELKVQESQARIEVGTLQIQLAEKQQRLKELETSIDIIPQVEADLAKLNRDYEVTRERYMSLVQRRESASLAQKVEQSNNEIFFKVINAPIVPYFPSGPNRPLLLAGVLLVALGMGAAWCVVRFLLHPVFFDYRQLKKVIDLPVLGAISNQMGAVEIRGRRLRLASFFLALTVMFGVFGTVLMYQQQASEHVRALMSELGV